ncbi:MAG: nucleotidyltransferase domain-containing protein [Actinomycetota bacterium]|nr:nucleotidyltransferase domain-containing protein [Actinomycetota bacterium]
MKLNKPLNVILGNQTRAEILRMFIKYPGEFTGRHVARLCKLPQATVQKQLSVLVDNDILISKRAGRGKIFSLNMQNILYPALKDLYEAEDKVLPRVENLISQAIKRSSYLRDQLVHASIYGSVVKGEETPESDIDLLLLFKEDFDERLVNEKFENVNEQITTISGMSLHLYAWGLNNFDKINKELLRDVEEASKLVYGKNLEELKKEWRNRQKRGAPA